MRAPAPSDVDVYATYPEMSGFWTWDVKRDIVYGDANLAEYFGHELDELAAGASLEGYVSSIVSEDTHRVADAIHRSISDRSEFRERYKVRTKTMGVREILAIGRCYYDAAGCPSLFPGWFVDVTSAVKAEAAYQIAAHHIEHAKAAMSDAGNDFISLLLDNVSMELEDAIENQRNLS